MPSWTQPSPPCPPSPPWNIPIFKFCPVSRKLWCVFIAMTTPAPTELLRPCMTLSRKLPPPAPDDCSYAVVDAGCPCSCPRGVNRSPGRRGAVRLRSRVPCRIAYPVLECLPSGAFSAQITTSSSRCRWNPVERAADYNMKRERATVSREMWITPSSEYELSTKTWWRPHHKLAVCYRQVSCILKYLKPALMTLKTLPSAWFSGKIRGNRSPVFPYILRFCSPKKLPYRMKGHCRGCQ